MSLTWKTGSETIKLVSFCTRCFGNSAVPIEDGNFCHNCGSEGTCISMASDAADYLRDSINSTMNDKQYFKLDDIKKYDIVSNFLLRGLIADVDRLINTANVKGYRYWLTTRYEHDDVVMTINAQARPVRNYLYECLVNHFEGRGFEVELGKDDVDIMEKLIIKW